MIDWFRQATRNTSEERLENGLFLGHAYSITSITEVNFMHNDKYVEI